MTKDAIVTLEDKKQLPFLNGVIGTLKVTWKQVHEWLISSWIVKKLRSPSDGCVKFIEAFTGYEDTFKSKQVTKDVLLGFVNIDRSRFDVNIQYDSSMYDGKSKTDALQLAMDAMNLLLQCYWHKLTSPLPTVANKEVKKYCPEIYEACKLTALRTISHEDFANAVKAYNAGLDLPLDCGTIDYVNFAHWALQNATNSEGETVPITLEHVEAMKNALTKTQRSTFAKAFHWLITSGPDLSFKKDEEDEMSDSIFDTDDEDSDSDSDSDDDFMGGGKKGKGPKPKGGKGVKRKLTTVTDLIFTSPADRNRKRRQKAQGHKASFNASDSVNDFKFGANDGEAYTLKEVNADPQHLLAQAWLGTSVMFWIPNCNEPLFGTIGAIADTTTLGFQIILADGSLSADESGKVNTYSAFETAQMAMTHRIDGHEPFDVHAEQLTGGAAGAKAKKAGKAFAQANPRAPEWSRGCIEEDVAMLHTLNDAPTEQLKTSLESLSSGNTLRLVRWVSRQTTNTLASTEYRFVSNAREVSLSLNADRPGLVLSDLQIIQWVYMAFQGNSLQELAPALTNNLQSATRSINNEKQVCTVSEAGVLSMASAAKTVKRQEVDSVLAIQGCFASLRYLWLQFLDNTFVLSFFAKLDSYVDHIKNEFGADNFGTVQILADTFVKQTRHDFMSHLAKGLHINDFTPFGGEAGFQVVLGRIRAWHAKHITKSIDAFTTKLSSLNIDIHALTTMDSTGKRKKDQSERPSDPRKRNKAEKAAKRKAEEMAPPAKNNKKPDKRPKITQAASIKRHEVAVAMGFESVGEAVGDWASKRRAAGLPVECFWKSVAQEHGGPQPCTNPKCP